MKSCPLSKSSIESIVSALDSTTTASNPTLTFNQTAAYAAFGEKEGWDNWVAENKPSNWKITTV
jgi:hypothetical protein